MPRVYATDNIKVGDIYGLQEVLEANIINPNSKAKNPVRSCKCKCTLCGKISYKQSCNLLNGKESSCRCRTDAATAARNKANSSVKIGNFYGYLEVLEDLGFREQKRGKQESWYRCKCHNCGNKNFEVTGNNLQSKGTTSCGCVNSRGENLISQILTNNQINFSKQYTFEDLTSPLNSRYKLRFDFAIFNNDNKLDFLIEFDGRQHYDGPEGTWSHSKTLEEIQAYDKLKNEYCKSHNIKLKRIPYYEIGNLTIANLMDNTYVI